MNRLENLKKQLDEVDAEINELLIKKELLLATIGSRQDNMASFIMHMAKAVDYGYKGNYGFIGTAFGCGMYDIDVDFDKAKHYLQKYYDDYKLCKLEDVSADSIITAIYNLATTESCICDRDGLEYSSEVIDRMLGLYREIVTIAEIGEKLSDESTILDLYQAGVILYSGQFYNTKEELVKYSADVDFGTRAIKLAAKMGSKEAKVYMESEDIR